MNIGFILNIQIFEFEGLSGYFILFLCLYFCNILSKEFVKIVSVFELFVQQVIFVLICELFEYGYKI